MDGLGLPLKRDFLRCSMSAHHQHSEHKWHNLQEQGGAIHTCDGVVDESVPLTGRAPVVPPENDTDELENLVRFLGNAIDVSLSRLLPRLALNDPDLTALQRAASRYHLYEDALAALAQENPSAIASAPPEDTDGSPQA